MADASSPLLRLRLWLALLPPALRVLLVANVATYVVFVLLSIVGQGAVLTWLALPGTPAGALARPWTALTWGVTNLYPGVFGLLSFVFGAMWLSWLGRDYEAEHGAARLFGLYVWATLGGTALALAAGAALGGRLPAGGLYSGVWGPLLGVLCGVAVLHPDRRIGLLFLGEVALKWIAIVFVVLELAFSKDPSHLGAALAGALVALALTRHVDLSAWARPLFGDRPRASAPRRRPAPAARAGTSRAAGEARTTARAAEPPDVDKILDKILDHGVDSLTDEERRILNRAGRG